MKTMSQTYTAVQEISVISCEFVASLTFLSGRRKRQGAVLWPGSFLRYLPLLQDVSPSCTFPEWLNLGTEQGYRMLELLTLWLLRELPRVMALQLLSDAGSLCQHSIPLHGRTACSPATTQECPCCSHNFALHNGRGQCHFPVILAEDSF